MKYYTDFRGENPLSRNFIRELIMDDDFASAWYILGKYVLKMNLEDDFHKNLMRNRIIGGDNTLIMTGRGLGKSYVLNTSYSLASIVRDRDITIANVTRTAGLSMSFVSELKREFEDGSIIWDLYGDLRDTRNWSKSSFTVKRNTAALEPTLHSVSINSPDEIVGKHFHMHIYDDIQNMKTSGTKYMRDKLEESLDNEFFPAFHPFSKYQQIHVIGTHYHFDDIYTRLEKRDNFYTAKIPSMIKDKNGDYVCTWRNAPEKTVKRILNTMQNNPLAFQQQYQQKVQKGDGGMFKGEWMQYFSKYFVKDGKTYVEVIDDNFKKEIKEVKLYAGVDLAISQKDTADYFVFAVIGIDDERNIYFLDFNRGRYTFHEQKNIVMKMAHKWEGLQRIGIESVAYQQALFQELQRTSDLPLVKIRTINDKVSRLNTFSALFESSKVYIHYHMENLLDLTNEFLEFPEGDHDDIPDAFCLAWETAKDNQLKPLPARAGGDLSQLGF